MRVIECVIECAQDDDGSVGTAHWLMRKRNPKRTGAVATRDGVGGRIIAGVFEKHRDKLHQSQQLQRQVWDFEAKSLPIYSMHHARYCLPTGHSLCCYPQQQSTAAAGGGGGAGATQPGAAAADGSLSGSLSSSSLSSVASSNGGGGGGRCFAAVLPTVYSSDSTQEARIEITAKTQSCMADMFCQGGRSRRSRHARCCGGGGRSASGGRWRGSSCWAAPTSTSTA
eukprot:COSAG05_NODE_487_length_9342_cov_4.078979_8_plen_226_part_00